MRQYLRQALYDALASLGDSNRYIVIYHIQKEYGIRLAGAEYPSIAEIKSVLESIFGEAAEFIVDRFDEELQKYAIPVS
jgi:hypothetical protein